MVGKAGKILQDEWGDAPTLYKGSSFVCFSIDFFEIKIKLSNLRP